VAGDPVLRIVDAEAGGDISRVIIDGMPPVHGDTVAAQCADFARRFDHLRLKLIQPPHGALHMCPVLLLPPREAGTDFGVIIMESMGYPPISGSNLFCAAAVALEHGFARHRTPETPLRVETPAGIVRVDARWQDGHCRHAAFENTPARLGSALSVDLDAGARVPVTRVAAGVDYAVVDAAAAGLVLSPDAERPLLEAGRRIAAAAGTDFVLFHEAIRAAAPCLVAVFQNPGVICRSPTGTGTSALLALAQARGLLRPGQSLVTRSPSGGTFTGRILSVDDDPSGAAVRTSVSGDVATGPVRSVS